jgi:hypothetical protein
MARATEAKTQRKKLKNDPARMRGTSPDFDTFERKTPTIKKRQERKMNKHKSKRIENWMNF